MPYTVYIYYIYYKYMLSRLSRFVASSVWLVPPQLPGACTPARRAPLQHLIYDIYVHKITILHIYTCDCKWPIFLVHTASTVFFARYGFPTGYASTWLRVGLFRPTGGGSQNPKNSKEKQRKTNIIMGQWPRRSFFFFTTSSETIPGAHAPSTVGAPWKLL